jgi:DNA-directed RNA polymerase specialized sigma24 family protein
VNRRALEKLYKNHELSAFVTAQARRFFSCIEDREDVISEVWEKFAGLKIKPCDDEVRPSAFRIIHASYMRAWRKRKRIG